MALPQACVDSTMSAGKRKTPTKSKLKRERTEREGQLRPDINVKVDELFIR